MFLEGVVLFGLFPFVALLLLATGEARSSIAGAVLAAFSIGGILYSLAVGTHDAHLAAVADDDRAAACCARWR